MIQKNRHWKIWLVSLLACSGFVSTGQNIWPQFRGPENNMVAKSAHLPETWGTNLNVKWTFDMPGESYSSPIVSEDKITGHYMKTHILKDKYIEQFRNIFYNNNGDV
jgi:hypothetical protein